RTALIVMPRPGAVFARGSPVELLGASYSPDFESASSGEMHWSSDSKEILGTGSHLVIRGLSIGRHHLTLTSPDGLGGSVSASVEIEIEPEGKGAKPTTKARNRAATNRIAERRA